MARDLLMTGIECVPGQPSGEGGLPHVVRAESGSAGHDQSIRLTLLGGFGLLKGGEEVVLPLSAQRLVALLALRGRPLSRAYLAEVLWSEYPVKRSMAGLRTALWRANHTGFPVVSTIGMRLYLAAEVEVDVRTLLEFSRAAPGDPARASAVIARSEWLNLSLDLLPDWYDDWLIDDRESVRQLRLHTLENLAGELSRQGRHAEAIQAALDAVRLEPLRETAHAELIKAHLAEGNRSEALRQFSRCRKLLAVELGVEPSEAIYQLFSGESRNMAALR
jgi:DNA-binding SARP family transcriptional activator